MTRWNLRHRLLMRVTAHLPCRVIDVNDEPYLERYWLGRAFGITAYLHRFRSSDGDRNVHDHPWTWALGVPLTGGYDEERLDRWDPVEGVVMRQRKLRPGAINVIRGADFHRIAFVLPGTWTLFVHARRTKGWGFLKAPRALWRPLPGVGTGSWQVIYEQPFDQSVSRDWHLTAPMGWQVRATQAERAVG